LIRDSRMVTRGGMFLTGASIKTFIVGGEKRGNVPGLAFRRKASIPLLRIGYWGATSWVVWGGKGGYV